MRQSKKKNIVDIFNGVVYLTLSKLPYAGKYLIGEKIIGIINIKVF